MPVYNSVAHSTFLDAYGDRLATSEQYDTLAQATTTDEARPVLQSLFTHELGTGDVPSVGEAASDTTVTVALVLDRAHSASGLLERNWAGRQAELAFLGDDVWSKYGADADVYDDVTAQLSDVLGADKATAALAAASSAGYESSVDNRTIWLTLSADEFKTLFGTHLIRVGPSDSPDALAWAGNLNLPDTISGSVKGIWVDEGWQIPNPAVLDATEVAPVPLSDDGTLGIGNDAYDFTTSPSTVFAKSYNFPDIDGAPTPAVAVIEMAAPDPGSLTTAYNDYRTAIGLDAVTAEQFQIVGGETGGSVNQELTLDISVVAGAAPRSTQVLYSNPDTVYQLYQNAFFATAGVETPVLTSSWFWYGQPSAHSPFQWAYEQLFVDGLLANVSVHLCAADLGSAGTASNGAANAVSSISPAAALVVGGTSLASLPAARTDPTLDAQVASVVAVDADLDTLFGLVASGLKDLPLRLDRHPPSDYVPVFETVWNGYQVSELGDGSLQVEYDENNTGAGGVNTAVRLPSYQAAFGLPDVGRALPDVSALAGGDAWYHVLYADYVNGDSDDLFYPGGYGGTSAATPLWASLTAIFDAVFEDQRLPYLGFYNDLLYTAAVIAPGSFNDITQGNNTSSYYGTTGPTDYVDGDDIPIVPTGNGYDAEPGFDLATGLGTPNGLLLARALTAIAHAQRSFGDQPDMLVADGTDGWTSGTNQTLMLQAMAGDSAGNMTVEVTAGGAEVSFDSAAAAPYAWTSRFAQQALQMDFDRRLLLRFDKQFQGMVSEVSVQTGDALSVSIDTEATVAAQATLSSPFGFADFTAASILGSGDGTVRVARPVAIAETENGRDDRTAIVRLRDSGRASVSVTFYRVDDFEGTIDGIAPGEAGYAAAAQGRAYQTGEGGISIANPSRGNYGEATLLDVDAGDLIAMWLDNNTRPYTCWGFSAANEVVAGAHVSHLWNYGLNTWGWEESRRGGDRDYNDLVVQLDFTSKSGSGWLA